MIICGKGISKRDGPEGMHACNSELGRLWATCPEVASSDLCQAARPVQSSTSYLREPGSRKPEVGWKWDTEVPASL